MASNSESNASPANKSGKPVEERLKPNPESPYAPSGAAAATSAPATAKLSPRRQRYHFGRSLSELSSPLRRQRRSQGRSQDQDKDKVKKEDKNQEQTQSQNLAQNMASNNDSSRDNQGSQGSMAGRGTLPQASAAASPSTAASASARPVSITSSNLAAARSPSHSPLLSPLAKSRTANTVGGQSILSASTTGQGDISAPASVRGTASTTASPNSSRRPSVRTSKDFIEEYRLQHQDQHLLQSPQKHSHSHSHSSSHSHSYPHLHRHHHSNSLGYIGSHSTTVAALTAAAAAVAAAPPTGSILPNPLSPVPTNNNTSSRSADADRSMDEQSPQNQERQASTASAALSASAGAGAGSALSAIDPAAVRAAAATLQRMQRDQSRKAARVLKSAVADLDGLSTATSQRLDTAYGSILGRIGTLQDTILALRSLASAARATNRRFSSETEAIIQEIDHQLSHLKGGTNPKAGSNGGEDEKGKSLSPEDQQRRLEELSERVHRGRQAVQDLSERVDTVRSRVELWERADRAWQERTRTRLKALWVIVTSVILIIVVVLVLVMVRWSPEADKPLPAVSGMPDLSELTSTPAATKFHLPFSNNPETASGYGVLQHLFDEL